MNPIAGSEEIADSMVRSRPAGRRPAAPRRMPLRATGLLAILAVMVVAMLLVAPALMFRDKVQGNLEALQEANARHAVLLQRRQQEAVLDGSAAGLKGLAQELRRTEADQAEHLARARQLIDGGMVTLACLAWFGITCIGALAMLFFSRLAIDIGSVRKRALAIVGGDRGRGQPLVRNDELSDLAQALDRLADALSRRERDLQIERRHVMHQEKLAAVGSMAAGVLREIGNPIAAIDGYARAMIEAQQSSESGPWCDPGQILHETGRLLAITRGIAELAATPASEWQLASLNEIVTKSVALLRYEPRLEGVSVVATLDPQLPALPAIADRLVQLVINLVINSADATATLPPRTARIELATRSAGAGVELCVSDNGCGMAGPVLERAFEPLFTTKPAGLGTGLGLPLCRSIANDHGGSIELQSAPGQGTRVVVWLPLDNPEAAGPQDAGRARPERARALLTADHSYHEPAAG
jgi:two-component system NtrC family sensor kinase